MFKARLELNYSNLDLGAEILADLVSFLPERQDAADVYEELAKYPFARVREAVANKKPLTDETVRVLAHDKSQAVLIALINNDAANQRIAMNRIYELIAADDANVLQAIFSNLKNMTQLDTARIFHMFTIHKDAAIRLEVARSSDTNAELLHRLARDEDPDVRDAVLTTLRLHSTIDTDNDWGD